MGDRYVPTDMQKLAKSRWEDEDKDDADEPVKASWDDEDEPEAAPAKAEGEGDGEETPAAAPKKSIKPKKKGPSSGGAKKMDPAIAARFATTSQAKAAPAASNNLWGKAKGGTTAALAPTSEPLTAAEQAEAKARMQREIEEEDLNNAKDLFAVSTTKKPAASPVLAAAAAAAAAPAAAAAAAPAKTPTPNAAPAAATSTSAAGANGVAAAADLESDAALSKELVTEADYIEYANAIAKKLAAHSKSIFYLRMVNQVVKQTCLNMEVEDVRSVDATVSVILNDKIKAQQAKKPGKKKKGGIRDSTAAMEDMVEPSRPEDDMDFLRR